MSNQAINSETGELVSVPILFVPDAIEAKLAWNAYQELCKTLLTDSDYAQIKGKKARKRSGWAKLRRAYNISLEIIEAEWQGEALHGFDYGYLVTVRASFPDGRFEDADGYCDNTEFEGERITATRHNVRSKAVTRAKNRATADLLGSGEVSAEEFIGDGKAQPKAKGQAKPKVTAKPNGNLKKQQDDFFGYILSDIPYYNHENHIKSTLKKIGYASYKPENEMLMAEALREYANMRANEKAKAKA